MKIIIGLGNPGSKYQETLHNIGFQVVDRIAAAEKIDSFKNKHRSLIAGFKYDNHKVILVKPQTYMNLSGAAVQEILSYYKAAAQDVLVVCDDVNLPAGMIRFRLGGSSGGHNGLKSIESALGSRDYPRLRVGIGLKSMNQKRDLADYVLSQAPEAAREAIEEALGKAKDAALDWLGGDVEKIMSQYNQRNKADDAGDESTKPIKGG